MATLCFHIMPWQPCFIIALKFFPSTLIKKKYFILFKNLFSITYLKQFKFLLKFVNIWQLYKYILDMLQLKK